MTNAPVAEAVIEIRVRLSRPVVESDFDAFRDRLKDQFPKAQSIRFVASHMQFGSDEEVKNDVSTGLIGVRLDDQEGRWVVQAKSDGLAVSRLPPYESWDGLVATLRALWPVYVEVFEPSIVLRLGVRYINRVPLPDTEKVDLDTVLTAGPKIPPTLPQDLTQFVTRVVFPLPADGIVLTVLQSLEPAPGDVAGRRAHVVLDIDAACEQTMSPTSPDMWGRLDSLRRAKNMAFFGSLTEPTWKGFV
ncbi:MAG: TIGR04255 family protein [Rubrivivax sp.]|nr:TIGR04255 family protein [Rubrivivax sp.]